jgi:hypothetical protein
MKKVRTLLVHLVNIYKWVHALIPLAEEKMRLGKIIFKKSVRTVNKYYGRTQKFGVGSHG